MSDSSAELDFVERLVRGARLSPDEPEEMSARQEHGDYVVEKVLGKGGHGTVYLAFEPELNRKVAIKVPHPARLADSESRERFLQESRLIAEVQHPQIVEIYHAGEDESGPYLVMEYCEGGSLADWLRQQTYLPSPEACAEIIGGLAGAVQAAHEKGIVHRDLNPRNILLVRKQPDGLGPRNVEFPYLAKISDFGLGKWLTDDLAAVQTQSGMLVGTIPYMAPEQTVAGPSASRPAVDIHALGLILYELLTGTRPFVGQSALETLELIRTQQALSPKELRSHVPEALAEICERCLRKNPDERYLTAQELKEDLDRFLKGDAVQHRSTVRQWLPVISTRLWTGIAAAVVLVHWMGWVQVQGAAGSIRDWWNASSSNATFPDPKRHQHPSLPEGVFIATLESAEYPGWFANAETPVSRVEQSPVVILGQERPTRWRFYPQPDGSYAIECVERPGYYLVHTGPPDRGIPHRMARIDFYPESETDMLYTCFVVEEEAGISLEMDPGWFLSFKGPPKEIPGDRVLWIDSPYDRRHVDEVWIPTKWKLNVESR